MKTGLRLNLGCGNNLMRGYINVDKYGSPDIKHDLETIPWPWKANSVSEVVLNHVLEHIGESTEAYLSIIKELYRVCMNNTLVYITVPHPRHDDFINDPTHVRAITPASFSLFSKSFNKKMVRQNSVHTSLGMYLNVDFEMVKKEYIPDPEWQEKLDNKECAHNTLWALSKMYNNVFKEIQMTLRVIK